MKRFALLMVAILMLAACTSEDNSTEEQSTAGDTPQENQTPEKQGQKTMADSPVASVETSPGGIDYTLISLPGQDDVTIQVVSARD